MVVKSEGKQELTEREGLLREYNRLTTHIQQLRHRGEDFRECQRARQQIRERIQMLAQAHKPRPVSKLETEVIDERGALRELREDWDEMLVNCESRSPFLTWEWWWPWLEECGRRAQPYLLIVRDREGRLVGGAPLMIRGEGRRGLLAFMGTCAGPDPAYMALVAAPDDRPRILQSMLAQITADAGSRFRRWRWEQCPMDAELGDVLTTAAQYHWQPVVQVNRHCIHGPLPDNFDDYISQVRHKKRRNLLRRQYERVAREWGPPEFKTLSEYSPEALQAIDQMAQYNIVRRQTVGDYSRWNDEGFRRCLGRITRLFADQGWMRLFTISVAGRLVAALLAWVYEGSLYCYQIGETAENPQLGLGQCVISYAIEQAIEEHLEHFEFLGEGHRWKREYFPLQTAAATLTLGQDDAHYWFEAGRRCFRKALGRALRGACRHDS